MRASLPMPGIRISRNLKDKVPAAQREKLDEFLWTKSGGKCFLCESPLNRASDLIEADHDEPDSEGGLADRGNLNLAHSGCNRFKRNNPSVNVRPYLKFEAFVRSQDRPIDY